MPKISKIATYTDLHGTIPNRPPADVDIVVFAGDILGHNPRGSRVGNTSDFEFQDDQLFGKMIPFFKSLGKPTIFIPGNHDIIMDRGLSQKMYHHKSRDILRLIDEAIVDSDVHFLVNSGVTIRGIKFWGSPYVPYIDNRWAFQYPQFNQSEFARATWDAIPEDTEILVTHTPPSGIMDAVNGGAHYGCRVLASRLNMLLSNGRLKAHIFGHSHVRGTDNRFNNLLFVNGAISAGPRWDFSDAESGSPYENQSLDPIVFEFQHIK